MLYEMRIRLGGDPRGHGEFIALREELAKLSHPACPDVDWARVEQWCLTLFDHIGADLQTAAAFALARSQRHGVEGMCQGVTLIETLCGQWAACWPPMASVRLDILAWLCVQWQALLRTLGTGAPHFPELLQLDSGLARLQQRLEQHAQPPVVALHALRQQIESLIRRMQHTSVVVGTLSPPAREPAPAVMMPVVILPPNPMPMPEMPGVRRPVARWLAAAAVVTGLVSGAWWLGSSGVGEQRLAQLLEPAPTVVTGAPGQPVAVRRRERRAQAGFDQDSGQRSGGYQGSAWLADRHWRAYGRPRQCAAEFPAVPCPCLCGA